MGYDDPGRGEWATDTVRLMTQRTWAAITIALAAVAVGCGDDDEAEVPESDTQSAYIRAIMESTSHDEVVVPGGDMVVAVNCDPEEGGLPLVTVVAEGLADGTYVGVFEPSTGVDLSLQGGGASEAIATAQMALDEDTYVVTFDSINGGEFDLLGC